MITKVHLTEIEARANAATAGPWTYHEEDRGVPYVLGPSTNPAIGSPNVVATTRYSDRFMKDDRDNMRFCAHAREDIPALIAALRVSKQCAHAWHQCVETILTMAGFSCALSSEEAVAAMQTYVGAARTLAEGVTTCGPADQSARDPKPVDARQNEGSKQR